MDAKYLDDVVDVMMDLLVDEMEAKGKKPDDNYTVEVSSLNLRSLLDYCAILRPILDAVQLGEVEQYQAGFRDGHREGFVRGQDRALEHAASRLEHGAFFGWSHFQIAEYLRTLKSKGGN